MSKNGLQGIILDSKDFVLNTIKKTKLQKKLAIIKVKLKVIRGAFREIRDLNKIEKEFPTEVSDEILEKSYQELTDEEKSIQLRLRIARKKPIEDIWSAYILTGTKNKDVLEGISDALDDFTGEEQEKILKIFENIDSFEERSSDTIEYIYQYFLMKKDCPYPEVIEFIDEHLYLLTNKFELLYTLVIIVERYTQDYLFVKWDKDDIEFLTDSAEMLCEADFAKKTRESFINLVNGVFLSLYNDYLSEIDLIDQQSKRNKLQNLLSYDRIFFDR